MNIKLNLNTIAITIIGSLTIYKIVLEVHSITSPLFLSSCIVFPQIVTYWRGESVHFLPLYLYIVDIIIIFRSETSSTHRKLKI